MASVWCAQDRTLDRQVAIKLLAEPYANDELAGRRFKREARAAARLSGHPNVVTIYDVGEAPVEDEPARPSLPRHGVPVRRNRRRRAADRHRRSGGGAELAAAGGGGARLRAPPGRHPSRRQAGQLPARPRARPARSRFRDRPARHRGHADREWRGSRHGGLPGSRARPRAPGHGGLRPLRARRGRVRAARRRAAVHAPSTSPLRPVSTSRSRRRWPAGETRHYRRRSMPCWSGAWPSIPRTDSASAAGAHRRDRGRAGHDHGNPPDRHGAAHAPDGGPKLPAPVAAPRRVDYGGGVRRADGSPHWPRWPRCCLAVAIAAAGGSNSRPAARTSAHRTLASRPPAHRSRTHKATPVAAPPAPAAATRTASTSAPVAVPVPGRFVAERRRRARGAGARADGRRATTGRRSPSCAGPSPSAAPISLTYAYALYDLGRRYAWPATPGPRSRSSSSGSRSRPDAGRPGRAGAGARRRWASRPRRRPRATAATAITRAAALAGRPGRLSEASAP